MEYLGTSNLCTHVKAKRKLHEEEARRIFSQIAQGLEYMHVQSIAGGFDAWQEANKPVAKPELPSFE